MPWLTQLSSLLLLAQADPRRPGLSSFLVPFAMIAVLFYFMVVRPERRKKADLLEMLQNLKKNDRVVTIGGIHGTVVATSKDAEEVTLRIDENTNTKVKFQRSAIARVITADGNVSSKGGS
jgi:preprotein translocase subunit YajC